MPILSLSNILSLKFTSESCSQFAKYGQYEEKAAQCSRNNFRSCPVPLIVTFRVGTFLWHKSVDLLWNRFIFLSCQEVKSWHFLFIFKFPNLFLSAFLVQNGFRDRDELANQTYRIIVHFWVIFCTKKPKSKRLPIYPNLEKYCRDRDRLANPSLYYNFLIIFTEIKSSFA